ncbi:MAG: PEP/pyruvate-binding domain-containing protein [Terriglobia bacterium]|nr:PEP/pyruvate-binding domain-containing protein [Terriglobia bacterium]
MLIANTAEQLFERFENLMPFRVQDILLVSSLYDSFILREDGRLNELMIGESLELNLQHIPGITHVSSGAEALELAKRQPRFNLIVTNLELGDMDAAQLAREVKATGLDVPVVVLAYDYREIKNFRARNPVTDIDRIFLWQGNIRILISIVKYVEDKRNVLHDTQVMGVPVMLVVEDNIRYYSSFLPVIYTELITQSRRLISEGLNVAHKLVRLRARPKILLCSNYEEAESLVMQYREYLFGVISDVEFPRNGQLSPESGFSLADKVRSIVPDAPIVLQSSRTAFQPRALEEGCSFLRKRSPTLLNDLRRFLIEQLGFGDFVFRMPDGREVARARDLNELEKLLHEVPDESIAYHSARNHFSHWLRARTEFTVAQKLRPRKVSDFPSIEALRRDLIDSITEYRHEQSQVLVGDFNAASFTPTDAFFLRIGSGSLGGKARGLAFVRHLLHNHRLARRFPGIRIAVPPSFVLATGIFDRFLAENQLHDFAIQCDNDDEIAERFLDAQFPSDIRDNLLAFLNTVHYPIAVRSSSLLEDSQYQPFTGVYETYMLANQHPDLSVRLDELLEAIKRVYSSTFSQHAKRYVRATPYRLEEEKMAVIIQQVVGSAHGQRFYPDFSGVVRTRNFYPVPPITVEDGIATVALGLGRTVVDGGKCLSFCPRYPQHLIQFSSVEDILNNSQNEFWALELNHHSDLRGVGASPTVQAGVSHAAMHTPETSSALLRESSPARECGEDAAPFSTSRANARRQMAAHQEAVDHTPHLHEVSFPISAAESDGTLHNVASTYSADNHAVYDGMSRPGARIVSFAPILKYGVFPLPALLDQLMRIAEEALRRPVEVEFAVRMPRYAGDPADFGFLQMRPLVLSREGEELRMEEVDRSHLVCQSSKVLGHGRIADLRDAIVVDLHRFERARSQEVAESVAQLNARLTDSGTPYLLIGVGRWGSNDPWLGIPVEWDQISGARVIVEAGFRDFRVTPSQGSHFFQNLTAFQVGYFTVNPDAGEGFVDWDWLASSVAVEEDSCVRHLHFDHPLVVVMNGKTSQGMIFKPDA